MIRFTKKIKYFIIFTAVFSVSFIFTACSEDPITNIQSNEPVFNIDKFEQNIRTNLRGQTVGYVYAINQNGQLKKSGDSGFARTSLDGQLDQSPTKRMNIASITKPITAVAIFQLLERRNLTVDSLIAPWLPPTWVLGPGVDTLKFRDLMSQRSGLNSVNANFNGTLSFNAMRDSIASGVVNPPTYNYLNLNFALFRVIIPALWKGLPGAPAISEINATSASFFYRFYVQQEIMDKMGVTNADCVPSTITPETLFYTFGVNTPGVSFGDWSMICGGGGWYLSAVDLAAFMAYIRYDNTMLSQASRDLMDNSSLGWQPPRTGDHGLYMYHSGAIGSTTGAGNTGNMTGLVMKFPNNVEAVLMVNSDINGGQSSRDLLIQAYDDAWE